MLLTRAGPLAPRGGPSCALWHRLSGVPRPSLGGYVTGTEAMRGVPTAGWRYCCLSSLRNPTHRYGIGEVASPCG